MLLIREHLPLPLVPAPTFSAILPHYPVVVLLCKEWLPHFNTSERIGEHLPSFICAYLPSPSTSTLAPGSPPVPDLPLLQLLWLQMHGHWSAVPGDGLCHSPALSHLPCILLLFSHSLSAMLISPFSCSSSPLSKFIVSCVSGCSLHGHIWKRIYKSFLSVSFSASAQLHFMCLLSTQDYQPVCYRLLARLLAF